MEGVAGREMEEQRDPTNIIPRNSYLHRHLSPIVEISKLADLLVSENQYSAALVQML